MWSKDKSKEKTFDNFTSTDIVCLILSNETVDYALIYGQVADEVRYHYTKQLNTRREGKEIITKRRRIDEKVRSTTKHPIQSPPPYHSNQSHSTNHPTPTNPHNNQFHAHSFMLNHCSNPHHYIKTRWVPHRNQFHIISTCSIDLFTKQIYGELLYIELEI